MVKIMASCGTAMRAFAMVVLALAFFAGILHAQTQAADAASPPPGYAEHFANGPLEVYRQVQVVNSAVIVYTMPGVATQIGETEISYYIFNSGAEAAKGIYIEQEVPNGVGYRLSAGDLAPGEATTVSLKQRQDAGAGQLPEPVVSYALPPVSVKAGRAMVGEMTELWLSAGGAQLAAQDFEVFGPSGSEQWLRTDNYGYAAFVPREEGAHRIVVANREASEESTLVVEPRPLAPAQDAPFARSHVGNAAGSAFMAGGISGALGNIDWPVGFAILVNLLLLAGLVRYAMRLPPHDALGNVPKELAGYRAHPEEKTAVDGHGHGAPEQKHVAAEPHHEKPEHAHASEEQKEEKKPEEHSSRIAITPRQIWNIERAEKLAEQEKPAKDQHPRKPKTRHIAG
jgi:hypothetical protein